MAALEALSSTDQLFNDFIIYDTISATSTTQPPPPPSPPQGRRKKQRRRRTRCKNRQEAETQRITHIAVERNRRKQMNQHLSVLRSLMPTSYVQRGDQASIVGGAIEFVKELERLVHSLEAQKLHQMIIHDHEDDDDEDDQALMMINSSISRCCSKINTKSSSSLTPLISHLFFNPDHDEKQQQHQQQLPTKYTSIRSRAAIGDMEVTLIETHANLRILCQKIPRQLTKLVTGLHSLCLTVLHINVTAIESLVLYSISAKVEEGCQLNSADDIAGSIYHMLRITEQERLGSCDHVPI